MSRPDPWDCLDKATEQDRLEQGCCGPYAGGHLPDRFNAFCDCWCHPERGAPATTEPCNYCGGTPARLVLRTRVYACLDCDPGAP